MANINAYLTFGGNTEEAMNFYKSVFGGDFMGPISRYGEMPDSENMPEEAKQKVMHSALPIGNSVLMASDGMEGMGGELIQGTNFTLTINPESKEEADKLFNALAEGGKVTMPLDNTFWGAYFGMLTDKYGIQWMVNYQNPQE